MTDMTKEQLQVLALRLNDMLVASDEVIVALENLNEDATEVVKGDVDKVLGDYERTVNGLGVLLNNIVPYIEVENPSSSEKQEE
jgi:hypothetical protein